MWHSRLCHVCQCPTLNLNIFYYLLEKIMKIWYFDNIHRDESNTILYAIFCRYILVENQGQNMLNKQYIFSN